MSNLRRPKECFSIIENQTFVVFNELSIPTCEDGAEPLTMHDSTFSRFSFVIINAEKKAATANIPVSEMPGIFFKVEEARFEGMVAKLRGKDSQEDVGDGPAYSVQLSAGALRGKTPAQALLEDPGKYKPLMESQRNWLNQNLEKFPRNKIQIDAITAALELFKAGNLKQTAAPVSSVVTVYKSGMRPLIRKKRSDGMCFVYEISIGYNAGTERPVGIEIRNYYAPVVKRENGLLNVMARERDKSTEVKNTFWLSMEKWLWFQHIIDAQIRTFENIYAPHLYKRANAADAANRSAFSAVAR